MVNWNWTPQVRLLRPKMVDRGDRRGEEGRLTGARVWGVILAVFTRDGGMEEVILGDYLNGEVSTHVKQQYDPVSNATGACACASSVSCYYVLNRLLAAITKQMDGVLNAACGIEEGNAPFVLSTGLDGFYPYFRQ
ncbi:hypothetical protein HOY82DRAFT_406358 [Tuber indicum]|nr:hypothetical protein HOY82DRAFT_406358 [Tuber indicum]